MALCRQLSSHRVHEEILRAGEQRGIRRFCADMLTDDLARTFPSAAAWLNVPINGPRFSHAILTTEKLLALLPASARQGESWTPQRREL